LKSHFQCLLVFHSFTPGCRLASTPRSLGCTLGFYKSPLWGWVKTPMIHLSFKSWRDDL
jgi:hypothetical protein